MALFGVLSACVIICLIPIFDCTLPRESLTCSGLIKEAHTRVSPQQDDHDFWLELGDLPFPDPDLSLARAKLHTSSNQQNSQNTHYTAAHQTMESPLNAQSSDKTNYSTQSSTSPRRKTSEVFDSHEEQDIDRLSGQPSRISRLRSQRDTEGLGAALPLEGENSTAHSSKNPRKSIGDTTNLDEGLAQDTSKSSPEKVIFFPVFYSNLEAFLAQAFPTDVRRPDFFFLIQPLQNFLEFHDEK
ncbi:hypothetical protein O181_024901 [Austropuccinia psidii MF-1]|uniref:Uncharacterized protein n=1 Tax=Austropuccinia psidii MF-1 TaxID=1389203 RepID=A0A9Q3GZ18_9BASI|nr:hypothetical protein [Austropuccinia psidii MF-1]